MTTKEMKKLEAQLKKPTAENVAKLANLYKHQDFNIEAGNNAAAVAIQNAIDELIKDKK